MKLVFIFLAVFTWATAHARECSCEIGNQKQLTPAKTYYYQVICSPNPDDPTEVWTSYIGAFNGHGDNVHVYGFDDPQIAFDYMFHLLSHRGDHCAGNVAKNKFN